MKVDVSHIAKLANLPLTEPEKKKFENQLLETLKHVDSLSDIDTANSKPTSQVTGLENVTREDETLPSLSQDEALRNAKSTEHGLFKVKGVLVNE